MNNNYKMGLYSKALVGIMGLLAQGIGAQIHNPVGHAHQFHETQEAEEEPLYTMGTVAYGLHEAEGEKSEERLFNAVRNLIHVLYESEKAKGEEPLYKALVDDVEKLQKARLGY
jgi:hypothetical protein